MSPAARDVEFANVSRALLRKVTRGDCPIFIAADCNYFALAQLLVGDGNAYLLDDAPSYHTAEQVIAKMEAREPLVRVVLICSNAWSDRVRSAVSARPWPVIFEPLRGLGVAERAAFARRATASARAGRIVVGIHTAAKVST